MKSVWAKEFELFLRSGNEFKISKTRFAEGNGKQDATPSNRLFVSLVAQLNGKLSQSILDWFSSIEYISGMDGKEYAGKTLEMLFLNQQGATEIKQLFTETNLGFNELDIELDDSVAMKMKAESVHNLYDADGTMVGVRTFSTDKMESEGTKKMIEIAGPLVDAILSGKILVVDELDAKLHPFLTRKIIGLFMDRRLTATERNLSLRHTTQICSISNICAAIRSGLPKRIKPIQLNCIHWLNSVMMPETRCAMTAILKRIISMDDTVQYLL